MGWTEDLFQKAESWLSRVDGQRKGILPSTHAVRFEDLKVFLNYWVILLSGRSWTLQEAESWPAVDSERLFFPPILEIFEDSGLNRKAYLWIACHLAGCTEDNFSELRKWRHQFQTGNRKNGFTDFPVATLTLHQMENVRILRESVPWSANCFRSLMNLWIVRELPQQLVSRSEEGKPAQKSSSAMNSRKKKAREQIQVIEDLGSENNENPLVHSFEKLHTTDDYQGGQKRQDGEDELAEQADSLDELDLRQVIRSRYETKATLKGDYVMDLDVAESHNCESDSQARVFHYDEWNESQGSYHDKWCTLEERRVLDQASEESQKFLSQCRRNHKARIDQLTRCFYNLFKSPRWKSRQPEGTELDLDALVSFMGTPPEQRSEKMNVYLSRQNHINELNITLLFDRSLSSDSWVGNRRVLDIIRESLVVTGEALKKFPLPVKLAAFSSQTRNRIHFDVLKDFQEDWSHGLERMMSVEPSGYTRIGAALRHASADLQKRKAKHKWIILLSDSKPTDFDKYEGRYGIRDVRKAIQEARASQIGVICLSIDKDNRAELAEMFGPRGYEMLSRVDELPERLGMLLRSLVQRAR